LFLPAAAQVKKKTSQKRQKGKNNEVRRRNNTTERGCGLPSEYKETRNQRWHPRWRAFLP
jgi:hypothetical protein